MQRLFVAVTFKQCGSRRRRVQPLTTYPPLLHHSHDPLVFQPRKLQAFGLLAGRRHDVDLRGAIRAFFAGTVRHHRRNVHQRARQVFDRNPLDLPDFVIGNVQIAQRFGAVGGPLTLIETVGLRTFVAECERMAASYGQRFTPPAGLRARAKSGESFYAATPSAKAVAG